MTCMVNVLFDRLLDMSGIDTKEVWCWPDSQPFSLEDVLEQKKIGLLGDKTQYGDTWRHPVKESRDRGYHIARIIYFMENPQEIDGIEVDNPCFDNGILPGCKIIDGRHRVAAGILIGLKTVKIEYGGRSDIEDYLMGISEERPEEILTL